MPFTAAHPAAILPLRRWLDVTALSCGAVAPDFEYFARLRMQSDVSHSALGLVTFDVPMGLALFALVHALVKRPLVAALPHALGARLRPWAGAPAPSTFSGLARVLVAVLVGAVSHLLWDACTHRTGFVVERSAVLASVFTLPLLGDVAVYRALQHASTLFGLACVGLALRALPVDGAGTSRMSMRGAPAPRARAIARRAFALIVPASALLAAAWRHHSLADAPLSRSYGHLLAAACGGAIVGVLLASAITSAIARRR